MGPRGRLAPLLLSLLLATPAAAERKTRSPRDPGRQLVGALFALRHQLHWKGEEVKLPTFRPHNSTFMRWVGGSLARLPKQAAVNCWEAVFAGAIQAGAVSKGQVADVYRTAQQRGEKLLLQATPNASQRARLKRRPAVSYKVLQRQPELGPAAEVAHDAYTSGLAALFGKLDRRPALSLDQLARAPLRTGDVVVYQDHKGTALAHMALALGKRTRDGQQKLLHLCQLSGEEGSLTRLRVTPSNLDFGPETTVKVLRPKWPAAPSP